MKHALELSISPKHTTYSKPQAVREAQRCLYCFAPPCVQACPTAIDIPAFINKIATDNVIAAAKTILSANILGTSCARVCPVEELCAGACVYNDLHEPPIEIGRLQDYATSFAQALKTPEEILGNKAKPTQIRVALIGGGPASIAAAALLAHASIKTVVFEKQTMPGGLNTYGIAPYKFKHHESLQEVEWLSSLGIEFRTGTEVGTHDIPGKMISFTTLKQDFDGIFIGIGLGDDNFLHIPGVQGPGVVGACKTVAHIKTDASFSLDGISCAHVIGGGNTAMDIAHELKLLGIPKVSVLYRKGIADMSAYAHERNGIMQVGVTIQEHVEVREIIRNEGKLVGFKTTTSDDLVPSDLVVFAIGQKSPKDHCFLSDLTFDHRGRIVVDKASHRIAGTKIWAAGDCVNGGKEVVYAVAEAKLAVADMIKTLRQ